MFDLTGFQRDLLYCVAGEKELYGLGNKKDLESYRNIEVNNDRLYSNLNTLLTKAMLPKAVSIIGQTATN
jgi:hypothetical protein